MKAGINTILIPVQFDAEHLSVVRQAALLAIEHNADVHLLFIYQIFPGFNHALVPRATTLTNTPDLLREQVSMLNTWKRWMELDYGIIVKPVTEPGNWKKTVVKYAAEINADLIVLKADTEPKPWYRFWKTPLEYVISKCHCPVFTLYSEKTSMAEWKNIVIPVTSFIPRLRIQAIQKLARVLKLKIHLIALAKKETGGKLNEFRLLTETLKMLKHSGNIQVECKYLHNTTNPIREYMDYTRSISADALMTNMKKQSHGNSPPLLQKLEKFFLETRYGKFPEFSYPFYM